MVTDVTPNVTVMVAVPVTPPAVALTVAVPTVVATSCPTSETDTTFGFELTHVIVGFAIGPVVVATRRTVWPRTSAAVAGLTATDVTPDVTVMVAVPVTPPAVAVTVTVPTALATS